MGLTGVFLCRGGFLTGPPNLAAAGVLALEVFIKISMSEHINPTGPLYLEYDTLALYPRYDHAARFPHILRTSTPSEGMLNTMSERTCSLRGTEQVEHARGSANKQDTARRAAAAQAEVVSVHEVASLAHRGQPNINTVH